MVIDEKLIQVSLSEDPAAGMDPRQVKFVDMLFLFKGNKAKAYISAGYKAKTQDIARRNGSRLMKNDRVQRLLAYRIEQARQAANLQLDQARVLRELSRVSFSNIQDFVTWDEGGANFKLRASADLSEDAAAAIKKVESVKRVVESDGETKVIEERTRIELYDKRSPLNTLAEATRLVDNAKPVVPVNISFNLGGRAQEEGEGSIPGEVVAEQ